MNPVSVSYRYIGTWYRFDMGDFGDIGIGLNILLTDTDISVSVYWYRSNSNTLYMDKITLFRLFTYLAMIRGQNWIHCLN